MGGGSSNQEKTNQVNKDAVEQLKQSQNNPNNLNQNQNSNLKHSKIQQNPNINKNQPQNLYDKNNQYPPNINSIHKDPLNSKNNATNENHSYNQNYQHNNYLSNQLKESLKKITKSGQSKVVVSILRIAPNSKFPNVKNLQQTQSHYESSWTWKFQERDKKWNFNLQEPQSMGVQFVINQSGQFLKGDQNQWILLNQMISTKEKVIDKKNYFQQSTDLSFQNQSQNNIETIQQLQNDKKKLYKAFNQEYIQRFAQFPQTKLEKPQAKNKSLKDSYLHVIKKKFQTKQKDWLMTVQILQNTDQFSCSMLWRTDSKDKAQLINQLLEEEKKLLQLRKQIYIHKMSAFKS